MCEAMLVYYAVFFLGAAFGMSFLCLLDMVSVIQCTRRITSRMAVDAIIHIAILFFTLQFFGSID
ncbi:hypothetical protein D3C85_1044610 [compost metagenome]